MPTAEVYGDSVSDSTMDPTIYGGGRWFDGVCNVMGWTRVGKGVSPADLTRGAIGGTTLQTITGNSGATGVPVRIVPYTPAKLIIEYGTNDFFYADDLNNPTTYAAAWDTMMTAILAMAVQPTQIIVVGMTPLAAQGQQSVKPPPFNWAQDFQAVWQGLEDVNKAKAEQYGATYVDMTGMPVYWIGIPYGWDGVHPKSNFAQAYYTSQFLKAINPAKYWGCGSHP
jgi:lysophospholipase L1-like esterase